MIRRLIHASVLLLASTLSLTAADMIHTTDTLAQVKSGVAAGSAVLLDVREQEEWDAGHLKSASLAPLSALGKTGAVMPATLPKDKPIYIHCKAGGRCLKAAEILKANGYDARPLAAGYGQLVKEGFEKAE